MDINSLLSPQDSPATETPSPLPQVAAPSPAKRTRRQIPSRTPSNLSVVSQPPVTSSPAPPLYQEPLPMHGHYQQQHQQLQHQQQQQQQQQQQHHQQQQFHQHHIAHQGSYTNGRGVHSATHTPPSFDHRAQLASPHSSRMTPPHMLHRQASTPSLEALVDLASMQHAQQTARQQSVSQRPSISLQNIPRTISGDSNVSMKNAEQEPRKPRTFTSKFLDAANLDVLNQLEVALLENPFDYYSHVRFVTILHQGLQNVLHTNGAYPGAAHTYDLLPQLRAAYESMDQKYNFGERLWEYRITDEMALAQDSEERLAVIELFDKATKEEPYSAKLWVMYGDYISHLITCAWDPNSPERWTEEDKRFGKEMFTGEILMDVWQRGSQYLKYDVADSSLVWDRYLDLLLEDLQRHYSPDKARTVAAIFTDRLSQPHATWGNTLSKFSTFNSQYNQNRYEDIMAHAVAQNSRVKEIYAHREEYEFSLLRAIQSQDQGAEYYAITRYLKWEKKTIGVSSFPLVNALYERAHVRFPVDASLWEDHVEFLLWQKNRSVSDLDVLERATIHCPWSGNLWALRILTLEAEGASHRDIEHVKHSATRTGMLEHADIEELIKVQIAWCGYLRRKAFDTSATEDDPDIAEVGIRSALELVHEIGSRKYGRDWQGDPKYRLERIHIKFWTQHGRMDEARALWDSLTKKQQDSYDFWDRFYKWEMVAGAREAGPHKLDPSRATTVLERGLKRLTTLDHPERLLEMYINHCEQHENVLKVRSSAIERRRAENIIAIRRAKEQASTEEVAAQNHHAADGLGKRKREQGGEEAEVSSAKKTRPAEADESPAAMTSTEAATRPTSEAPSATATQKRDREHTVIIVRNLPIDATQTKLRKFFTDSGVVRNITLKPEGNTITATVEFEAPEEAEYALLKATKGFEGHEISITKGESTTLYVANYPAHADEAYLRKLFSPYGEVLEIRLPSLKFDAHRRFAYVQFSSATEAKVASASLDGTEFEGLKLLAKLSDPGAKKNRSSATDEGREVYVRNTDYTLKKKEIMQEFRKFGAIVNVNMPQYLQGAHKGNNKGFCFVVFENKADADKAVAEMNGKELKGRTITVELAKAKGETKPKTKSEIFNAEAVQAADENVAETRPDASADTPMTDAQGAQESANLTPAASTPAATSQQQDHEPHIAPVADRSIALLNIPDTVTDARIATLLTTTLPTSPFRKITLMPQHGGAIIEFSDVSSVGKAGLALDGYEIAPNRKIRTGTVPELKKEKAEYRAPSSFLAAPRVKRPVAKPAGKVALGGRKKPGLGHHAPASKAGEDGQPKKEIKSNDAFRAMLLGGGDKKTEDPKPKDQPNADQMQDQAKDKSQQQAKDVEMKDGSHGPDADTTAA